MAALWTAEMVEDRIRECWDVTRRLPRPRMQEFISSWPPVVRDAMEAYGYTLPTMKLAAPSPQAIDRAEETVSWFQALNGDRDLLKALWLCCGRGWGPRRVGNILGVHRKTIATWRDEALGLILEHVQRQHTKTFA